MQLSVIIPVYNEEKYLQRCLISLMKQTKKADEIIIVDNNCTDKTIEIAKNFPVTIIQEKKQGMIFARNRGFNEAKYEIIARTDADSVLPVDWIKKIKENFLPGKIAALSGPIAYNDYWTKSTLPTNLYFDIFKLVFGHHTLAGPNLAITKNVWNKIHDVVCLNDYSVHEDIDLALHIHEVHGQIAIDRSLVVTTSARRLNKKPLSFFLEYPWRILKMFIAHKIIKKKPSH